MSQPYRSRKVELHSSTGQQVNPWTHRRYRSLAERSRAPGYHAADETAFRKNPIISLYDKALLARIGCWVCAIVALGLAAAILAQHPKLSLVAAAAFNFSLGCLQIPIVDMACTPVSLTNPRPPKMYIITLAFSTAGWLGATAMIFSTFKDPYAIVGVATGTSGLEIMTIACGLMGAIASLCCALQWIVVIMLVNLRFNDDDVAEAFEPVGWTKLVY